MAKKDNDDSFYSRGIDALLRDLCAWAHKVKVFDRDGKLLFIKEPPIWGKGMYENLRDMRHKMKLERIREEPTAPARRARS